jgi:hypothetical protein
MISQQPASLKPSCAAVKANSKVWKVWESRNAKFTANGGGLTLTAVSVSARGSNDYTISTT